MKISPTVRYFFFSFFLFLVRISSRSVLRIQSSSALPSGAVLSLCCSHPAGDFCLVLFFFFFPYFLATQCGLWGLSSPTRDWTRAPCTGNVESEPLDSRGRPRPVSWRWPSFPPCPALSQLDSGCVLWQESPRTFGDAPCTPFPQGMLASILWSAWRCPDACPVRSLFPLDIW